MYAVQRGHLEVVKLLVAAHAHVMDRDDSGKSVQDYAVSSRKREILGVINEAIERNHGGAKGGFSMKSPYFDFADDDDDDEEEPVRWPAVKGASPVKPTGDSPSAGEIEAEKAAGGGMTLLASPVRRPGTEDGPQTASRPSTKVLSRSNTRALSSRGASRSLSRAQTAGRMSSISQLNADDCVAGLVCHESEFTTLKDPLEYARRGMIEELRAILPQAGGLTQDGLNVKNELGRTPLIVACLHGQIEAMRVIIKAGGDIEGLDSNGKTCLFYAIAKRNYEATALLLASGADLKQVDRNGRTPLMHACMDGNVPIVTALLKAGASLNATDNKGRTPLMYATAIGSLETITELLNLGADPYARDLKDTRVDKYGRSLVNYPEIQDLYRSFKAKSGSLKKLASCESFANSSVGSISRLGRSPVPLTPFNPKANLSTLQLGNSVVTPM